MYDELIRRLRNRRICIQQTGSLEDFPLLCEAANAIEELSKDLERSKEWAGFWEEEANRANEKIAQYVLAVANKPKWIPVTERLPQKTQRCIVVSKCGEIAFAIFKDGRFTYPYFTGKATHWMPLPQPPKDGEL